MELKTKYLGLELKHPIVASPSPLSHTFDGIRRLEDADASAIVMFSLFEEQIRYERESAEYFDHISSNAFAESLTFFPRMKEFEATPDEYLELIFKASNACQVPIVASLNACSPEGWAEFAFKMQQAGAKALELNAYYVPEIHQSGRQVERHYVEMVRTVRRSVTLPIAVKLSPFFSSVGDMATQLTEEGADGLVLFNRLYQPDFDLDMQEVTPRIEISRSAELRLPLLWIANLYGHVRCSLAGTTGVHTGLDAVKYVLAGADVAMTASALLRNGTDYLRTLVSEFETWGSSHGYRSVAQMRGSMSKRHVIDPSAFDRANYIKVLQSFLPKHALNWEPHTGTPSSS